MSIMKLKRINNRKQQQQYQKIRISEESSIHLLQRGQISTVIHYIQYRKIYEHFQSENITWTDKMSMTSNFIAEIWAVFFKTDRARNIRAKNALQNQQNLKLQNYFILPSIPRNRLLKTSQLNYFQLSNVNLFVKFTVLKSQITFLLQEAGRSSLIININLAFFFCLKFEVFYLLVTCNKIHNI